MSLSRAVGVCFIAPDESPPGLDGNASSEQAMMDGTICQLLAFLAWAIVQKGADR
jgi:hypothetical protein